MKIVNKTLAVPDQIRFKLNSLDLSILESRGIPFLSGADVFTPLPTLIITGDYLKFGVLDTMDYLAIKLSSHHIVRIIDANNAAPEIFVNSSLLQYVQTFTQFARDLPYNPDEAWDDTESLARSANKLRSLVKNIDSKAIKSGTYWSEVCDDITVGNWSEQR